MMSAIVQECPPELAACEVCRRLRCESDEWLNCQKRLAAERYLRTGDGVPLQQIAGTQSPMEPACSDKQDGCAAC